jgi:hypothetical protein
MDRLQTQWGRHHDFFCVKDKLLDEHEKKLHEQGYFEDE